MSAFEDLLRVIEERPLSQSLSRVLQQALLLSDDELSSWVRLELMGYLTGNPSLKSDTIVPEYRSVGGNWYNDWGQMLVISDPKVEYVNQLRLRDGVAELEGYATATGLLAMRPTEFSEILRKGMKVDVTTFRFRPESVVQVLTNIKVQLLDHVASRRAKLAGLPQADSPKQGDVLQLKPTLYGVGIDLKALWRKMTSNKA
jgi:hypothetical protein